MRPASGAVNEKSNAVWPALAAVAVERRAI